jgi:peptide deformylase
VLLLSHTVSQDIDGEEEEKEEEEEGVMGVEEVEKKVERKEEKKVEKKGEKVGVIQDFPYILLLRI